MILEIMLRLYDEKFEQIEQNLFDFLNIGDSL